MTAQQIEQQIEQLGPWFYEFDLGSNHRTRSELPAEVIEIFQNRTITYFIVPYKAAGFSPWKPP